MTAAKHRLAISWISDNKCKN